MVLSGGGFSVLEGREMLAWRGSIIQRPMELVACVRGRCEAKSEEQSRQAGHEVLPERHMKSLVQTSMLGGVLEFKNQLGSEMSPRVLLRVSLASLARYHNQMGITVPCQVPQNFSWITKLGLPYSRLALAALK